MKIVFATHNKNKVEEINAMLSDIELISLSDIDCFEKIPETATTLYGIAVFLSIFGIAAGVELSERIYKLESQVESLKKQLAS